MSTSDTLYLVTVPHQRPAAITTTTAAELTAELMVQRFTAADLAANVAYAADPDGDTPEPALVLADLDAAAAALAASYGGEAVEYTLTSGDGDFRYSYSRAESDNDGWRLSVAFDDYARDYHVAQWFDSLDELAAWVRGYAAHRGHQAAALVSDLSDLLREAGDVGPLVDFQPCAKTIGACQLRDIASLEPFGPDNLPPSTAAALADILNSYDPVE